jgi:hypothetical protein
MISVSVALAGGSAAGRPKPTQPHGPEAASCRAGGQRTKWVSVGAHSYAAAPNFWTIFCTFSSSVAFVNGLTM